MRNKFPLHRVDRILSETAAKNGTQVGRPQQDHRFLEH